MLDFLSVRWPWSRRETRPLPRCVYCALEIPPLARHVVEPHGGTVRIWHRDCYFVAFYWQERRRPRIASADPRIGAWLVADDEPTIRDTTYRPPPPFDYDPNADH